MSAEEKHAVREEQDSCRQEAQESERSLRAILSASPIGICRVRGSIFEWVNDAMCRMTGYPMEDLHGKAIRVLFERETECLRAAGALQSTGYVETTLRKKDGAMMDILAQAASIDETSQIITVTDITYRARVEREQAKIGKLESLGVLAGGIAHDFNNILTMILGNISLGKIYMEKDAERAREKLTLAEQSITRAKELTQQLLTFSRGGAPITKVSSIADNLRETAQLALTGTGVTCRFDIAEDLFSVSIDEGQINQAIGHIVINAHQAMPQGGTLLIGAQNVVLENAAPNLAAGRYVRINITDNGMGIPEEHLDCIFDPYFTTKQKGSGLGLAICYSIIRNHQGSISVESTLGVGSTFHIYLPVYDAPFSGERRNKQDMSDAIGGNVLVMDDEEAILEIIGDILAYHGFTVDFARDGEEALCLYQERKYDAVILDLTVPGGMGGREAMKELLRVDPMVRAIVSSGYSNDPIMSDYRQYGFKNVIAKPYDLEELGQVLRSVISGN
ncbi:MAG: response regulator [Syntrophorhabdaceae bacterium]|nr:response regulator [Syntrophorhabdaceae bacterium]